MKVGKRKVSGRKKGEPTKTLSFRVKLEHAEQLKIKIKELISSSAIN